MQSGSIQMSIWWRMHQRQSDLWWILRLCGSFRWMELFCNIERQPNTSQVTLYSRVFNKHPGHSNFSKGLWSAQDRFLESPHLFKKKFSVQDNFIKSLPNYHISKLSRQDKTKTVFASFVIIYSEVFFQSVLLSIFFIN